MVGDEAALRRSELLDAGEQIALCVFGQVEPELFGLDADRVDAALLAEHDAAFRRESGAVASQFHDPPAIEPYSSELVAAERSIVLGKKSGIDSIRTKVQELGLDLDEDAQRELLVRVKELGTKKRDIVTDDEFRQLARG